MRVETTPDKGIDLKNPDYSDPHVQHALDIEAERRLRLRGLLPPSQCEKVRQRIARNAPKE